MTPIVWMVAACTAPSAPDVTARGPRLAMSSVVTGLGWSYYGPSVPDLAWGDLDGDGALDLAMPVGALPYNYGYRVFVGRDRSFEQVYQFEPTTVATDFRVGAWADADGDGDPDLLMGRTSALVLYEDVDGEVVERWSVGSTRRTSALVWADVDRDGDPDAIQGGLGLALWRNPGDGALVPEVIDDAVNVLDLAVVDRDGDGFVEVSVATNDGLWHVDNDGGALTLGAAPLWLDGTRVEHVVWADWLDEGQPSPAVTTDHDVRAYAVDGAGFQERLARSRPSDRPTSLAFADFDVDGRLDLAVGWEGGTLEVLRGYDSFTGRALDPTWSDADGQAPVIALRPADWDGDGDADLAVGRLAESGGWVESGVYESVEASFDPVDLGLTTMVFAWAAGDADNDGDPDVAISRNVADAEGGHGAVTVVTNTPDGLQSGPTAIEFPPATADAPGIFVNHLVWADVDADGDLDLVLATDVGVVIVANEAGAWRAAWFEPGGAGARRVAVEDFDGDGDLDLAVAAVDARMYAQVDGVWRLRTTVPGEGIRTLRFARLARGAPMALVLSDAAFALRVFTPGATPEAPWTEVVWADAPGRVGEIVPADVDDDGDEELCIATYDGDGDVIVDLRDGAWVPVWRSQLNHGVDVLPFSNHVGAAYTHGFAGDLDNDGVPDFRFGGATYQHRDGAWVSLYLGSPNLPDGELWVDLDRDGDDDLLATDLGGWLLQDNVRGGADQLPQNPPRFALAWADGPAAGPRGAPLRLDQPTVDIVLHAFDAESDPIDGLRFEFHDWRGGWRPATVEGLSGRLATAPHAAGGVAHGGTWRWAEDGADGEHVELRAVLDRTPATGGELRDGRRMARSPELRLARDGDGDGIRDALDACPDDATNDGLVPGVCDSETLAQGWWCAGGGGWAGLWPIGAALVAIRRGRRPR